MMPNDSMELLLELGTKILDYSRSITKHGWSINPSIQVLVNPEARCPSCNAWVQTNRIWFVDEEESLSSPQVTYLPTYSGDGGDYLLSNTNHTYLFDTGYAGNNTGSAIKDFVLLPVAWCLDKWEELVLVTDLPDDPTKCPKFYVFDSLNETIVGEGTSWGFPTGSKAGSKITFKAIKGNKWFIKDQMILI